MKARHLLIACAAMLLPAGMQAQKIDFNNQANANNTSSGYTGWDPVQLTGVQTSSMTVNGVTITIGHGTGTQATKVKSNWYANGVNKGSAFTEESKLVCDGIYGMMSDDDYGPYGKTTARVAISVKIKGLSAGTHGVMAYHNYVDGGTVTLPTIGVAVNGETKQTGIVQTQREMTLSAAAHSFVSFQVASADEEVELTYFSEPVSGTDYSTTYFYINSLEIGGSDADNLIQNPYPTDQDAHVNADDGSLTFSWTPAVNTPTKHTFYLGTSESEVEEATTGGEETTGAQLTKTGLTPVRTYFWRVDETINGITYKGKVFSFRPRRIAFPGADGAGKYAVGGRDGIVYHVTSLSDDGSEGTLRYGLETLTGARTIVFDVSGEIQLTKTLVCKDKNVTIAGQTAPGIGIMLRNEPFGANSDDGITRFIRFRYGHGDDWDGTSPNANTGNAAGLSANYGIMDHCLLGWGSDETFSSRGAHNISFQYNIIGESLNQNGHKNYWEGNHNAQHGYAATIAGEIGSMHHNLLAHNEGRNWSLGGGLDGDANFAGRLNIYNNVCYNWGNRATDGGAHNVNFVNNYYKLGPATTQNFILSADHEDDYAGTQQYYLSGNLRVSQDGATKKGDVLNDTYRTTIKNGVTVNYDTFVSSPFECWSVEGDIETAEAAFRNVLSLAGCNYERLDMNEARLIQETRDGTYTKKGSRSGKAGLIDKESDSEGWNGLGITTETRPANWDTDGDGIPNWYEEVRGWDAMAANNNVYNETTFYTNLEDYLNWLAAPHFSIQAGATKAINLHDYFAGYPETATFTAAAPAPTYGGGSDAQCTATVNGYTMTVTAGNGNALATVRVTATLGSVSLTRDFNIHVSGGTTGILQLQAPAKEAAKLNAYSNNRYNMAGQRVSQAYPGIVMQNGRKYVQ